MDYKIDAKNKSFGRLASEIALILQGKKHAAYDPRLSGEDSVVVTHVQEIRFSGNKSKQKQYYWHTGYMGHLKSARLEELFAKNPGRLLREAVEHMLPKNRLQRGRLRRLIVRA